MDWAAGAVKDRLGGAGAEADGDGPVISWARDQGFPHHGISQRVSVSLAVVLSSRVAHLPSWQPQRDEVAGFSL